MNIYKNIFSILSIIFLISGCSYAQISFEKHTIESGLDHVSSTCIADLDSDGRNDIAGTAWNDNKLIWWKNQGSNPIIWEMNTISDTLKMASFVVDEDMDGDNDIDLIVSGWEDNLINVYYNEGANPVEWDLRNIDDSFDWGHEVRTADMDNDGLIDIIGASSSSNIVAWWKNPGDVNSSEWTKYIIAQACYAVRTMYPGDIDNDGRLDIVTSSFNGNTVSWYKNNADLTWTKTVIENGFLGPHMVHIADFNNDGFLDIACAGYNPNSNQDVACWLNDGVDQTTWTKIIVDGQFNGALGITSADIDLDNDLDIIGTADPTNKVAVWLNDNNGMVWEKVVVDNFMLGAWGLSCADIDLDGDIDISCGGDNSIVWYENTSQLGLSIDDDITQKKIYINCYPNPFNPSVNISYNMSKESFVSIMVFDLRGNIIRTLKNDDTKSMTGNHTIAWDGKNDNGLSVSNGTYIINVIMEGTSSSQKICLVK